MKKIFLLSILLVTTVPICFSQGSDVQLKAKKKNTGKDRIVIDVTLDNWAIGPDSIKNKVFGSRGFGGYFMYDLPFGESGFSISAGAGIGSNNVHNNGVIMYSVDSATQQKVTSFQQLTTPYKLSKLSLNYVDVPFEIRYRLKADASGEQFKFALGVKAGYLINSHTKFIDSSSKIKTFNILNVNPYRYGGYVRIGYGWFGVTGYYSLSGIFLKGKGTDIIPFAAGITINPL